MIHVPSEPTNRPTAALRQPRRCVPPTCRNASWRREAGTRTGWSGVRPALTGCASASVALARFSVATACRPITSFCGSHHLSMIQSARATRLRGSLAALLCTPQDEQPTSAAPWPAPCCGRGPTHPSPLPGLRLAAAGAPTQPPPLTCSGVPALAAACSKYVAASANLCTSALDRVAPQRSSTPGGRGGGGGTGPRKDSGCCFERRAGVS